MTRAEYDRLAATEQVLESRRRRLGTALHQLAVELARERRRAARLERELAQLLAGRNPSATSEDPSP
jgi:hypothetical protein